MGVQGKDIIIVGDSHTELYPFGTVLEQGLRDAGARVTTIALGGKAASDYLARLQPVCRKAISGRPKKCQSLNDVAGQKFDLAIIALGTNDAANMNRAATEGKKPRGVLMDKAVDQILEIASKLAPVYVWVGPPRVSGKVKWYTQDAMDALYEAAAPKMGDAAIDSRLVTSPDGDGVHLSAAGNRRWAEAVLGTLLREEIPENTSAPAERVASVNKGWMVGLGVALVVGVAAWFWWKRRKK